MSDKEKEAIETSEAEIAVHWGEEDHYYSSPQFVAQANMVDPKIIDRFGFEADLFVGKQIIEGR
jgi:acetyl-CoA synthetase